MMHIKGYRWIPAVCLLVSVSFGLSAATYRVSNAVELASGKYLPGDTILLLKGDWNDQHLRMEGKGTLENPIRFLAEEPGKVVLRGASSVEIRGTYLVVSGLFFPPSQKAGKKAVIEFAESSSYCRLTNSKIESFNPSSVDTDVKWIGLRGHHNRVDHCSFSGKHCMGVLIAVWLREGVTATHRIDHNYFGFRQSILDRKTGKELNGQEIIRVGDSKTSLMYADCVIENNLFEKCNGEVEVISNKSCGNIYRNNLFYECVGTLCLRHGHDCVVENNYFVANNATSSTSEAGGIRVMGEQQQVRNNVFYKVPGEGYRAALSLTKGNENITLNRYSQVKEAQISGNIFIDCNIAIDVAVGTEIDQPDAPIGSTIVDNLIYNSSRSHTVLQIRDKNSEATYGNNRYNRGNFSKVPKDIQGNFSSMSAAEENRCKNYAKLYKKYSPKQLEGELPSYATTGADW